MNVRNSQNQHFKLKLPHSRAYLNNLEVARYSEVTRPETFARHNINEYMPPAANDIMKQETK